VRGSVSPTGFIGPNASVRGPRSAHDLDRQTAFEVARFLEGMRRDFLGRDQRRHERFVLLAIERTVHVGVVAALVVARGLEHVLALDRVRRDDRRDAVVVRELALPEHALEIFGQCITRQRSGRDSRTVRASGMLVTILAHAARCADAPKYAGVISAEKRSRSTAHRTACGHAAHVSDFDHERAGASHLFLHETDRVDERRTAKTSSSKPARRDRHQSAPGCAPAASVRFKRTGTPRSASCHAHSVPARPPPTIVTAPTSAMAQLCTLATIVPLGVVVNSIGRVAGFRRFTGRRQRTLVAAVFPSSNARSGYWRLPANTMNFAWQSGHSSGTGFCQLRKSHLISLL